MEPTYGYETRIDKPQSIKIPIKNIVSELIKFFNDFSGSSFDGFKFEYRPVFENDIKNKFAQDFFSEYFPPESSSKIQDNIKKILKLNIINKKHDKKNNEYNFNIHTSSYLDILKIFENGSLSFKASSSIVIKHSFNFLRYEKYNSKEHFNFDPSKYKYNTIEIIIGYNTISNKRRSNIFLNMFMPVDLQEQSEQNFLKSIEERLKIKLSPYYFFQYLTDEYSNFITKKTKVIL